MPNIQDPTLRIPKSPVSCSGCGCLVAPGAIRCPRCGALIEAQPEESTTTELVRKPQAVSELNTATELPADARVVLQFLPSAHCVTLDLLHPVVLGRGALTGSDGLIDLTGCEARQHGVSRRHCLLKRDGRFLIAIDLDSTNGTYLNSDRLEPNRAVIVSSGDRLILGTLHVMVTFHQRDPHE